MDAKQACDKLNGFNFQNRYLVGVLNFAQIYKSCIRFSPSSLLTSVRDFSALPSARENGEIERGYGRASGEFGKAQETTRHRITLVWARRSSQ